jgi:hypothetical protein
MLDFIGIGAQKAGTTWLYERLAQHPQVRFPGGKEIHFWDWYPERGLAWYQGIFAATENSLRQGEITPAYAILPPDTIGRIHAAFPRARLFYLLRNPLERAWSAALMWLKKMEMHLEEASEQWFIDQFRSQASLKRGDYAACLQNWLAVYPREQLLLLRYEAIQNQPRELLARVCAHLDLPADFYAQVDDDSLRRKVYAGPGHPLPARLQGELDSLYRDKITHLEALLGEDFSAWRSV